MAKSNTKANMCALLAILLLGSLAEAVDIQFFTNANGCNGNGIGCFNVGANVCCTAAANNGASALISAAGSNVLSKVFRGGGCSNFVGGNPGRGNVCYEGGAFTGLFYYIGRRRSMLADPTSCDSQVAPNSVFFTEDHTQGHYVLPSSKVDETYTEMQNVPEAEKINWLKSHGAVYVHA